MFNTDHDNIFKELETSILECYDSFVNETSELEMYSEYANYISYNYECMLKDLDGKINPEILEKLKSVSEITSKARFVLWIQLFFNFTVGPNLMDILINKHMSYMLKHGSCKSFIVVLTYKPEDVKNITADIFHKNLEWIRFNGNNISDTVPSIKEVHSILYKEKLNNSNVVLYYKILYFLADPNELTVELEDSIRNLLHGTWDTYIRLSNQMYNSISDKTESNARVEKDI